MAAAAEWISRSEARCNSCGQVGPPSVEHLIHLAIGRVIFADASLDRPALESRLRADRWAEFLCVHPGKRNRRAALADAKVDNLICRKCNEGWANDLEIKAGAELNRFLFEDGAANARLLRRWIWFFCAKAAWIDSRTEALRSGPLQPMFKGFADPIRVPSQVRVAQLQADPDRWAFELVVPLGVPEGVPLSMMLVIRGTAFFAVPRDVDGTNPLPFPTTELTAGIRLRRDVPRIQAGAVALLPATQAILTAAPEI